MPVKSQQKKKEPVAKQTEGKVVKKTIDLKYWGEKVVKPYTPDSYCEKRLSVDMGFTADMNTVPLYYKGRTGRTPCWMPLFKSDDKDNILITVYDLDRNIIEYPRPKEKLTKTQIQGDNEVWDTYFVKRLHPDNVKDAKYLFPSSDDHDRTYPYIPMPLLEKWERRETVETLILTEGYFKSLCGSMHGIDIVGLGSITLFEDKSTNSIYTDIDRIIRDCKVKNIVIMYDGDCTDISAKDLERGDELTRRPRTFLTSLKRIFKLLKDYKSCGIWFMYVDSKKLQNSPKGLDDLLLEPYYKEQTAHIVSDICNPEQAAAYFFKVDLRKYHTNLTEYFHLESNSEFYRIHKKEIGNRDFVFNGNIYRWSENEHKLIEIVSKELSQYIRVGVHYYKQILVPTMARDDEGHYIMEHTRQPWSREAIKDDYGVEALQKIRKFNTFVNLPSHTDYKPVVNNCFNIYYPITVRADGDPARKNWRHIDSIIRHIFGSPGDDYEQYEMGMDYVQLLYQEPTQKLPILCLVSKERNTGKSSFAMMLKAIFDRNVVIVGGQEMMSKFNSLVSGRLVVAIEEIKAEQNKDFTERIKYLSTADDIPMEQKGKDTVMVANCTHYIINSNFETRFIYTNDKEQRFWVRKVPVIPPDKIEPDMMRYVRREIPAFLTYLNQRELYYSREKSHDRMYFNPEDRDTPWLQALFVDQRSTPEKEIRAYLKQWFLDFGDEKNTTCMVTVKSLKFLIPSIAREPDERIRRILKDNMELKVSQGQENDGKTERYSMYYIGIDAMSGNKVILNYRDVGRPFVVPAEKVLTEEEYKRVFNKQ